MKTEKEKFLEWCTDQMKNHGLKECRPYLSPDLPKNTTAEEIFKELNEMNEAIGRGNVRVLKDL